MPGFLFSRPIAALSVLGAATAITLSGAVSAQAQKLTVGSPVPALTVSKWVKGNPVTRFEKGKVYVVEFWATWCGPCRQTIPHLTALQKAHPNVTFVGVSVWENDQSKVRPFVAEMGSKMNYRVCMDSVPAGGDGNAGAMAKNWMTAAAQDGIPTAFIINGQGKVAWIGHPMAMEQPLSQIVAGKWDLAAAAADAKKKAAGQALMQSLREKLATAKTPEEALTVVNKFIADNPGAASTLAPLKFSILTAMPSGNTDAAAYLTELTNGPLKNNAQGLNDLAWRVVDPQARRKPGAALAAAALAAAKRASELMGDKDASTLDTVAAAYFATGDKENAIKTQEKAVSLDGGKTPELKQHLNWFKGTVPSAATPKLPAGL